VWLCGSMCPAGGAREIACPAACALVAAHLLACILSGVGVLWDGHIKWHVCSNGTRQRHTAERTDGPAATRERMRLDRSAPAEHTCPPTQPTARTCARKVSVLQLRQAAGAPGVLLRVRHVQVAVEDDKRHAWPPGRLPGCARLVQRPVRHRQRRVPSAVCAAAAAAGARMRAHTTHMHITHTCQLARCR
jgi:hypothetical protein